MLAALEIN